MEVAAAGLAIPGPGDPLETIPALGITPLGEGWVVTGQTESQKLSFREAQRVLQRANDYTRIAAELEKLKKGEAV